jgi:hypothetical protein
MLKSMRLLFLVFGGYIEYLAVKRTGVLALRRLSSYLAYTIYTRVASSDTCGYS